MAERAAAGLAGIIRGILRSLNDPLTDVERVSVNVHLLPSDAWPGIARAARTVASGLLVAAVLVLPFPAAALVEPGPRRARRGCRA